MLTFLLALTAILLLILLIRVLHKHQKKALMRTIESSDPLPPLATELPDLEADDSTPRSMSEHQTKPAMPAGSIEEPARPQATPDPGQEGPAQPWQDSARQARDCGDYESALRLCQGEYPKVQAFQQALVTLRARLREDLKQAMPPQNTLAALYHTAALADLFRADSPDRPECPAAILQAAALEASQRFVFDYHLIGYQQLKLLNKTDRAMLVDHWGEPDSHAHVEQVLGQAWHDFRESLQQQG